MKKTYAGHNLFYSLIFIVQNSSPYTQLLPSFYQLNCNVDVSFAIYPDIFKANLNYIHDYATNMVFFNCL